MKKTILFITLALFISTAYSQFWCPLEKRSHKVNRLLEKAGNYDGFANANLAFHAVDLNSGEVIASMNADMAMRPASTLKLLTTATALELLGPAYRYETYLEYTGVIDSATHTLHGNIIIKGGGDPSLGSKYFDETSKKQFLLEWTAAIQSMGIDSIAGGVIADAGIFSRDIVPPAWSWQNMGNYYGAGPSGLSIYDNYYSILFNTGKYGEKCEIEKTIPLIPGLVFDNQVTADSISYDNAYIFGAPYSNQRYIRGELPLNKKGFRVKGSMPDPAYIAAWQLDSVLLANGIMMQDPPATIRLLEKRGDSISFNNIRVHTTYSPGLSGIITETNVHSINLFAEHCMISSGIALGAKAETLSAIDSVMIFWEKQGMSIQGMALHDGSGLSMYNLITPRQMVHLLKYMKLESENADIFYNTMAVAGKTGTLKSMFKNSSAEGRLRAKSGTVNRVKAYAGYVTSKSGREIAFSMSANNFSCSSREARALLEALMIALSDLNK